MEADEKAIWIARRLLGFILSGNCCFMHAFEMHGLLKADRFDRFNPEVA